MSTTPGSADWLRIALSPGLGPARLIRKGLAPESLGELPRLSSSELTALGLTPAQIRTLKSPDPERLAAAEAWLAHPGHQLVAWNDPVYPPLLRRIDDAPPALFVNGQAEWLVHAQIAIVGSRNATAGGIETAREFGQALSRAGLVVTSGLAAGIDGAAHRAALDAGGSTVAVAGTGPDRVYPARHRDLARRIVDNGSVVSCFAPGTGPRRAHFPARNRIISGMSAGVVVIEAGVRSGSLITARLAGDQGREVFAVPGSIRNPLARGCHRLIRQGARLVESPDEILDELRPLIDELAGELRGLLAPSGQADSSSEHASGGVHTVEDPEKRRLLDAIGFDPTSVDEIIERTQLTTQAVSSMLLELELDGCVTSLGGGRYSRTGNDQESVE